MKKDPTRNNSSARRRPTSGKRRRPATLPAGALAHRIRRLRAGPNPLAPGESGAHEAPMQREAIIDCGWGRLLFGQTFHDADRIAAVLREEGPERRDIAIYVRDPHVVLAKAPQELFLDPSHTYRLDLSTYRPFHRHSSGFFVRRLFSAPDAQEINRIYLARGMVPVDPEFLLRHRDSRRLVYLIAEDRSTGAVLGTVTGVDHGRAFGDPARGASLWCLAVDPQATHPRVGETLVRHLAEHFQARGAHFLDLSVLHDNQPAIDLYRRLGFVRLPLFSVKRKNPINERLFVGEPPEATLNPYARIIVDEARRRGIGVEIIDAEGGFFRLEYGGRSIACRESLSELTSGVAVSMCDDKAVTRRIVERAAVVVPSQIEAGDIDQTEAFVQRHGTVVVKPARGEQGRGVAVGLRTLEQVQAAIERARAFSDRVLLEQCVGGDDLRLVVIDYRVVAAAIRLAARVKGDGRTSVRELIAAQSRRRVAATGGESRIPLDAETERCVREAGYELDDAPPLDEVVPVRRTANLHTGGTMHDVTGVVHPVLIDAAVRAARALNIPVTGIDLMVQSPTGREYAFIEANERPGLANHEPQPTAERFVDLLFPLSAQAFARRLGRAVEDGCPA